MIDRPPMDKYTGVLNNLIRMGAWFRRGKKVALDERKAFQLGTVLQEAAQEIARLTDQIQQQNQRDIVVNRENVNLMCKIEDLKAEMRRETADCGCRQYLVVAHVPKCPEYREDV